MPLRGNHPLTRPCHTVVPALSLRASIRVCCWFVLFELLAGGPAAARRQTGSTGALSGVILDPSGAAVPVVIIHLTQGDLAKSTTSDEQGRFGFLLLPPGTYRLQAEKTGFESLNL